MSNPPVLLIKRFSNRGYIPADQQTLEIHSLKVELIVLLYEHEITLYCGFLHILKPLN